MKAAELNKTMEILYVDVKQLLKALNKLSFKKLRSQFYSMPLSYSIKENTTSYEGTFDT